MTDTTDMRRDFEAWMIKEWGYTQLELRLDAHGAYQAHVVIIAWTAWQAATERATAIERERCAVVCESMPWVDGRSIPSNIEMALAIRQGGDT